MASNHLRPNSLARPRTGRPVLSEHFRSMKSISPAVPAVKGAH